MTAARLELAREEWLAGERRLERARRDPQRAQVIDEVVEEIRLALAAQVGQTYTLADLLRAYEDAGDWAREAAQRTAPGRGFAHDLTVVCDPVFARAARSAQDWSP
jgi:hypothetical protein